MPTYVALLRGINVGGSKSLKMERLREVFATTGATDVATYIQSGNVVFGHAQRSEASLARTLEAAIAKATKLEVPVVLRSAAQLAELIDRNPFARRTGDHVHAWMLPAPPVGLTVDARAFGDETYEIIGRDVYLWLPGGIGRSKLAATLARAKPLAGATSRNWRTVMKLAEMVEAAR